MRAALILILKNLAGMVLTPRVAIWAAKLAVHRTDNLIDDGCVDLLEAAYYNDVEGVKRAVEALVEVTKS